jgi:hypothetical protein
MFAAGRGAPRDDGRAAELYARGCELGEFVGCSNLGTMLRDGRGIAPDDGRAVTLLRKACDGDEPNGCHALATMQAAGRGGLPRDPAAARALDEHACSLGLAEACPRGR